MTTPLIHKNAPRGPTAAGRINSVEEIEGYV